MSRASRSVLSMVMAAALAGCAGPSTATLLAQGKEAICHCCNCLIPAGTKPTDKCPACTCKHDVVTQCDLGPERQSHVH